MAECFFATILLPYTLPKAKSVFVLFVIFGALFINLVLYT